MPDLAERNAQDDRVSVAVRASERNEWRGAGAGGGVSSGTVFLAPVQGGPPISSTGETRDSLLSAIARSVEELSRLMERADPLGRELFEFQSEMLRDPALAEPAMRRIDNGEPAALAWMTAMDDYIATFDDDGHEGRNMDLVDIRNRVLGAFSGTPRPGFPSGTVFVADDIEPSVFLDHDWGPGGGLALRRGSTSGHVAMLARAYGVPMVTGLGLFEVKPGSPVLVDGEAGTIVVHPDDSDMARIHDVPTEKWQLSGVALLATVNRMADLDRIDATRCQGIGLVRTEFLVPSPADFIDEERQASLYAEIARRSPGPTWIRLFDIGGDKPVAGLSRDDLHPFLGLRGIRLLQQLPEVLKAQARALLRAAPFGDLGIIVPMVTVPEELSNIRSLFADEARALEAEGVEHAMPSIGMMVETPAAALTLEAFDADFFAIGSSDLLQYVAAAARSDQSLSKLRQQAMPAMMHLVRACAATARSMGKPISVCGDLAGNPTAAAMFRDAGVALLSVDPVVLAAVARQGGDDG
jgi:phosphoenolpyruvate-protein phosphotransferase (PTS system enzyme I)